MDHDYEESESDGGENEEDPLEVGEGFMEFCPRLNRLLSANINDSDEDEITTAERNRGDFKLVSDEFFIRGLPWNVCVTRYISTRQQQPHLSIQIQCNEISDSGWWSCKADCEIKVLPQSPGFIGRTRNAACKFSAETRTFGYKKFLDWDIVADEANGYLQDGCIKIQAKIKADMPKGGVWNSCRFINPYMGFKNIIVNLQRADEQRRVRGPAIAAQIKQPFTFKTDSEGRQFCGINFKTLNTMKLEIVHKSGSKVVHFNLSNMGKSTSPRPRFVDAEVSFLTCDDGKKQSHAFKVSGDFLNNKNAQIEVELCSLKDIAPFFHPKGLTINLSLKISEGWRPRSERFQPHLKEFVKTKNNAFGAALLENKDFSDFILECEGERIPCHKAVLASGSPVFATMIQSEMQESVQNSMKIEDMTISGLKMLLKLIYGAASKNDVIGVPVAFDLLKAGEKYQIPNIRDLATNILQDERESKFAIEMICELFVFSKQMKITRLMNKAVYVFKMKGKEYVKSKEFSDIMKVHTEAAQEIISRSLQL